MIEKKILNDLNKFIEEVNYLQSITDTIKTKYLLTRLKGLGKEIFSEKRTELLTECDNDKVRLEKRRKKPSLK